MANNFFVLFCVHYIHSWYHYHVTQQRSHDNPKKQCATPKIVEKVILNDTDREKLFVFGHFVGWALKGLKCWLPVIFSMHLHNQLTFHNFIEV